MYIIEKHVKEGAAERVERIELEPAHDPDITILEAIKENPRAILYCVFMAIGPIIFGFDNVMAGMVIAMPAFQIQYGTILEGKYIFPSVWISLWNSLIMVGLMFGSFISGPISDRCGRRVAFVLGGFIGVISTTVIYTSDLSDSIDVRRGQFLAGKIILGISLGLLTSVCQTYISEVAPPRLRGPLLSMFIFFWGTGQLIAVSIVYGRIDIVDSTAYRVCFAIQWAFAGISIIVGLIVPESPTYYLKKDNIDKALISYVRLYGAETASDGVQKLQRILDHERITYQATNNSTAFRECFKGTNLRRTRIIIYANIIPQFVGVAMVSNVSYFLQLGGMSATNSVLILQLGTAFGLPANIISWFGMTKLGRRKIILWGTAAIGTAWGSIGVAGCFPSSSEALWFIGIMMMIIIFLFGMGVGGAYPVVGAETSSVRLRAKSQALGFFMNGFGSWLFNYFVPYLFNTDEANLGGKVGFFFFGLCVTIWIVVFLEVPEMKGRSYAELDELFEKKLRTREFENYVVNNVSAIEGSVANAEKSV